MVVVTCDDVALSEQNAMCDISSVFMCKMWWLVLMGGDLRPLCDTEWVDLLLCDFFLSWSVQVGRKENV